MRIIKLDAISSTNDFLRDLEKRGLATERVLVTAREQTKGKGQRGARWYSEPGKNVVMSVLVWNAVSDANDLFHINRAVSLAVLEVLKALDISNISVKWPNDIMAGKCKIGGILIENAVRERGRISSVIGIGLNVNQRDFAGLEKASSLSLQTGRNYDTDEIAEVVARKIFSFFPVKNAAELCEAYAKNLFRIGIPTAFEDAGGKTFMAKIAGVTPQGKLVVDCDDESVKEFNLKEIRMLY